MDKKFLSKWEHLKGKTVVEVITYNYIHAIYLEGGEVMVVWGGDLIRDPVDHLYDCEVSALGILSEEDYHTEQRSRKAKEEALRKELRYKSYLKLQEEFKDGTK